MKDLTRDPALSSQMHLGRLKEVGEDQGSSPDGAADEGLERELDRLSLNRALLDFEVANARTVDLTQRLVEATKNLAKAQGGVASMNEQLESLTAECNRLSGEYESLRAHYDELLSTRAFKIAKALWAVRKALHV